MVYGKGDGSLFHFLDAEKGTKHEIVEVSDE